MTTLIRIEHSCGNGLFRANINEKYFIENLECFDKLSDKHSNFPTPWKDRMLNRINSFEYCGFKSIEQIKEWIEDEWFNEIIEAGFKILLIDVSECREGLHQILYKKEHILQTKDITELFRTKSYI